MSEFSAVQFFRVSVALFDGLREVKKSKCDFLFLAHVRVFCRVWLRVKVSVYRSMCACLRVWVNGCTWMLFCLYA